MSRRARPVGGLRDWEARDREMASPVRCLRCRTIYDMGAVQPLQSYADCTVWQCPGCRMQVDDRSINGGFLGVGRRDVERVDPRELKIQGQIDITGHWRPQRIAWPPANGHYPVRHRKEETPR